MSDQSFKLGLTQPQRRLIEEALPKFRDRLLPDAKGSRRIAFSADELETIRRKLQSVRSELGGTQRKSSDLVLAAIDAALPMSSDSEIAQGGPSIYQFKIQLQGIKPPIWRRIQTEDCTLDKLHEHIQTAMGWTNSHLHEFRIDGESYGDPRALDDGFSSVECRDSTTTLLSALLPKGRKRFKFIYEYDFGDGWEHEILFEGCPEAKKKARYPICLEGERRCPPEDVGGIWGYLAFLTAISDANHERHEELREWIGDFDPEDFDSAVATKAMRQGVIRW